MLDIGDLTGIEKSQDEGIVLGTLLILTIWWFVSVRHWFKGPHIQGSEEEMAAIERSIGEQVVVRDIEAAGGQ